jgi:hypothetical protein
MEIRACRTTPRCGIQFGRIKRDGDHQGMQA